MSKQDLSRILSSAPEALQAHFKAASVRACEAPTQHHNNFISNDLRARLLFAAFL
ncbi:MAG: hypothetical protein IKO20_00605 [Bacteroidaceae bacterium]|nr:hypothetical protein [Bacteroidaceae bacterium]